MDRKSLSVFIGVAATLNFSRVAELNHMSVSAVSRTIARLEEDVGTPLLQRDRRSMYLTPAGREFEQFAKESVMRWDEMRRLLSSPDHLSGELSLFCSVTASLNVMGPVIEVFQSRYEHVDLMLHTGDQADGISRVLNRSDDLAVSGYPERMPQLLAFIELIESPLVLCAPVRDCSVRQQVLQSEVDWSRIPFILPERGVSRDMLDLWFGNLGVQPDVYAQVAGHEAIVAMVSLGLGVGVVPRLVHDGSGMSDRVEIIAGPGDLPVMPVGLCALKQRLKDPLLATFWQVAAQTYGVA